MKLIYRGENGFSETFTTEGPPLLITAADGLYGYDNSVHTVTRHLQDGCNYISGQLSARRIGITVQIFGNVVSTRTRIMKALSPKTLGKFELIRGDYKREIKCVIEKISVNTSDGSIINIMALCPNPFWREERESRVDIAAWTKKFKYPLTVEQDVGFIFGERTEMRVINVLNTGDVGVGMRVVFSAMAAVTNPAIVDAMDETKYLRMTCAMQPGDMITISTGMGEKRVALMRSATGKEENAFGMLVPTSTFMQLGVGDNLLRYEADSGEDWLCTAVFFYPSYLGV